MAAHTVGDESYAEYVAARWSTLYRLAVLLAGEDRADDLVQEALVRAYLSWPRRPEDDPPDEQVKGILARLALGEGTAVTPATDGLWSRIQGLPRQQRVVTVLRAFEYLSDADSARLLGRGHDAVEADAAAALAVLGATDSDVRAVLASTAEEASVPLPPIEPLLTRGHEARRRRGRRRLRSAATATAVLLLGLAVGSYLQAHPLRQSPRSSAAPIPRHLADLRAGTKPRATYAEVDTLHLGGGRYVVLQANPTAIATAGRSTYVSFSSGAIVRVDNESLAISPVTDTAFGPVVSDRLGRYVAWFDVGHGLRRIVVEPTEPRREQSGRREQSVSGNSVLGDEPPELVGITRSGDVVGSAPPRDRAWVWHVPGGLADAKDSVRPIEGVGNGVIIQVTPGEVVVQYPPNHFAVGRLEDDAFLAEEDLVATTADVADPRGRHIVYVDGAGEIHVGRRGAGSGRNRSHDLRLRLPVLASGVSGVAWEDDTHVLLEVADASMPLGALVRCDVDSGACEIAVRFGDAPHRLAR